SSMYSYLLFPAAVLTAAFIERRGPFFRWLLAALCIPGLLQIYAYTSIPKISGTARAIGSFIAANSAKTDAVLTNLELGRSPYKASDVMAGRATTFVAD